MYINLQVNGYTMLEVKVLKKDLNRLMKEQKEKSYGVMEFPDTAEWEDILEPYLKASARGRELGFMSLYTTKEQVKVRVLKAWKTNTVFKIRVRFLY